MNRRRGLLFTCAVTAVTYAVIHNVTTPALRTMTGGDATLYALVTIPLHAMVGMLVTSWLVRQLK